MGLQLSILDGPDGRLLIDPTSTLTGLRFSTNKHGFASLSCFVPKTLYDSFYLYDRPGLPDAVLTWNGYTVWNGRVEDVAATGGGVRLGAFGYWRALMKSKPYTALWSTTDVKRFRNVTENEISVSAPAKYSFNNENQLYTALKKGEIYITSDESGDWVLQLPHSGQRAAAYVSFDYDYTLPTDWTHRVQTWDEGFSGANLEDTITGDGANHTGSKTITIAGANKEFVIFRLFNATGANYTVTAESDAWYFKMTNVRVTASDSTVDSSDIVSALVTYVNGVNSTQLASTTALISAPGLNLYNEIYEDKMPSDILDYLAGLGNASGSLYEAGVWENRTLHFRQRGSQGRAWYVDVSDIDIERTIEMLRNAYYAVYQDATGRPLRTSVSTDSFSVARYGVTQVGAARADTTDSTQAGYIAATALADGKAPRPRAGLAFDRLYDASGNLFPNFMMRSGDNVTIRNLPPTLSTDIDRIRSFVVAETEYDADSDVISPTPEFPLPSLEFYAARQAAGIVT